METELAWAAGFFEGEGGIYVGRKRGCAWVQMRVGQSDTEPLERLRALFGGSVYPIGPNAVSRRQRYAWALSGKERIQAAYLSMRPLIGSRKRMQCDSALAEVGEFLEAI